MKKCLAILWSLCFISPSHTAVTSRPVPTNATTGGNKSVMARTSSRLQQVINTGTSVTTTTTQYGTSNECAKKFAGCMDTFCITDNIDGGRCQCSASHTTLVQQLTEINKIDRDSYNIATFGVQVAESGDIPAKKATTKRRVDLSLWQAQPDKDIAANKTGAELMRYATDLCIAQMPECSPPEQQQFMLAKYSAQIKSDCNAFENAIKAKRNQSKTKQAEAIRSVRSATYNRIKTTNKYDLGECTTEYKKCMQTTAGCGDNFTGCVGTSTDTQQNTLHDITRGETIITINAATYEILSAKRPMCDSILKQCENASPQVWDTFLREAAPELKTAELLTESNMRTSCMANISDCFQKACKDNIDPSDPDGSYDMCLSHPETVKSLCKVQIEPCIKTDALILDYVYARLAAMRVDACTTELQQCLQSEDRCGKDYTRCVGLDTNTIIRMCPYDKLVGCQKVYTNTDIRGDAVYDELATMVQGIMLNIDNNMLSFCQNAANEAMIRVCGTTENCDNMTTDEHIGATSLNYGICYYTTENNAISIDYSKCFSDVSQIRDEYLGRVPGSTTGEQGPVVPLIAVLDGTIFWELVTIDDDGNLTGADEYFNLSGSAQMPEPTQELIRSELSKLQNSVNTTAQAIEIDPTVQYCMTGRKIRGMKNASAFGDQTPRFPNLTRQIRSLIATSALKKAKTNYLKKYDELYKRQMKDYVEIAERQAKIKGENAKDIRRESARQACISLADASALPLSPPPRGWGMWLVAGIVTVVGVVATVVTFGAAGAPVGAGLAALWGSTIGTASALATSTAGFFAVGGALSAAGVAAAAGVATAAVGTTMLIGSSFAEMAANHDKGNKISMQLQMNGHHELNQWNFKQTIDTQFDWDTLKCTQCITSTQCLEQSHPLFGSAKCKKWANTVKDPCTETQF